MALSLDQLELIKAMLSVNHFDQTPRKHVGLGKGKNPTKGGSRPGVRKDERSLRTVIFSVNRKKEEALAAVEGVELEMKTYQHKAHYLGKRKRKLTTLEEIKADKERRRKAAEKRKAREDERAEQLKKRAFNDSSDEEDPDGETLEDLAWGVDDEAKESEGGESGGETEVEESEGEGKVVEAAAGGGEVEVGEVRQGGQGQGGQGEGLVSRVARAAANLIGL
jgi:hypothetical protein